MVTEPVARNSMYRVRLGAQLSLGSLLLLLGGTTPQQDGRRPNEPKGFDRVTELTFDGVLPADWTKRPEDAFEFIPEANADAPGRGIGRAYYRQGFVAGGGPVRIDTKLPRGYRSLYLSFWFRLSDNWIGHRSGVNKLFHLWLNGRNLAYLSAQGGGRGPFWPQVRLQGIAEPGAARNLEGRGGHPLRPGQWYHWEVLLTSNTPGVPDGRALWWINGRPVGSVQGITFIPMGGRPEWEAVSWNPTWGGVGGQIATVQWMDMDDIYISLGQ